ncbi:MAG: TraB family protein [Thermoplasmatota archaeon]
MKKYEYNEEIVLVGVDYLGDKSLESEISDLIAKYKPGIVGLTLCEKRFESLEEEEKWKDKPLLPSYKKGKTGTLIYQAFMDAVRENLRRFKGLKPESHIANLVPLADSLNVDVEFLDRDITLTLSRSFRNMSPIEKMKMIWYFRSTMLTFSEKKKSESVKGIEKHDDLIEGVLDTVRKFAPTVANRAKSERIEYISRRIFRSSKRDKIIAIVPESKLLDVKNKLDDIQKEEKERGRVRGILHLEKISKKVYTTLLRFASPIFFISLAVYLFLFSDVLNIWRAWLYWFIAVGGMAALGALLGRGHPISIITSFILAPFMSLTLIGPGWIAGYVELKIRNPKVRDLRELTSSDSSRDFLSNNIIRIFLVGTFSNVFTWIGLFIVLPLLISILG